jgi:hypothetical protein
MKRWMSRIGRAADILVPGVFFLRREKMVAGTILLVMCLAFGNALLSYHSSGHQALSQMGQWFQFDPRGFFMGQSLESGEEMLSLNVQPRSHSLTKVSAIWPEDERTIFTRMNGVAWIYHIAFAFVLLINALVISSYGRKT